MWYCARCTRQMKRMVREKKCVPVFQSIVMLLRQQINNFIVVKAQKPPQKPSPASASSAPVVKDTVPPATLANPTSSNSSSPGSGLTGWAAFGAKTNPSVPATSKLASSGPSGSSKTLTAPAGQKPVGLSGLAGAKSGLGNAKVTGSSNGNGSSQSTPKPPPPLTLGKQALNRSSSGESQGKGSASSGAGSPSSSQAAVGNGGNNGGGNGNNGNGSKGAPTSQESQLNAMKRLQIFKKKAAQKKLKK
ncbi:hypothetical protein GOODEAATRI_000828 [Goodea atripinnis]|uniref:Uncharacterized protein n=1 Tax=Goodea atripinnis TaxID=208336 RepID=A0ABV0P0J4_9TELE